MNAAEPWISEAELHAYLDGELAPERVAAVERHLEAHPDDARRLDHYRAQDDLMRRLYGPLIHRPLPPELAAPLLARASAPPPARRRSRLAAAAAAVLLLAGGAAAGWFARPLLDPAALSAPRFVAEAQDAHRIFAVEVRHPVEVPASEEDHLVAWLSKRLDFPLRAPDLGGFSFELVGGRLLPAAGGPAAQLMYQDAGGRRLTLYTRSTPEATPSAFRFEEHGGLRAFYWRDRGMAFALVGELPRDELLRLARATYGALGL